MESVPLAAIQMDHGIQCRAAIDTDLVDGYAERMTAADRFPPVDLFGNAGRFWIGDGWHRIMAARQIGALSIEAEVHEGGRQDALKHALHANALHGARRTNADKRRCVEIAIAEFSTLTTETIAAMCGVDAGSVLTAREKQFPNFGNSKLTGKDGKQYPAKRKPKAKEETGSATQTMNRSTPKAVKVAAIKELLASGHNVEQISDALSLSIANIRLLILEYGLTTLKRKGRGGAKISPVNVIQETVNAVVATTHGMKLIRGATIELSKEEAGALLAELRDAMKSLQWLVQLLKEKTHD